VQEGIPPHNVLVAVDGSEQSLRAIRYAANVFPPDRTHIVLFHVQVQLFELFADLDAYPHYKRRVTGLKRWATEQKRDISDTMDSAVVYFKQKGFHESAIRVKTADDNLGITRDIIKESYDGYHAIVVGRTGWSRFKDWLIKSTAMQLVAKIKHIPVVVVGGKPDAKNLLVAFDGSHGAMRGVACVGALVGSSDHRLQLYSMISQAGKFWAGDEAYFIPENVEGPIESGKHPIGPQLEEARSRLLAEGMAPDRISIKIHAVDRERAPHIVREAMQSQYGSVVLGRRGLITFIDEYFVGRISDQVLKLADQMAVWII
jgi:nucleotide-binding universal stress UspA family protein